MSRGERQERQERRNQAVAAVQARLSAERERRLLEAFRTVASSSAGREVLHALIYSARFGMLEFASMTGSSQTYELEGRRAVGRALMGFLREVAPAEWFRLKGEADARERHELEQVRAAAATGHQDPNTNPRNADTPEDDHDD